MILNQLGQDFIYRRNETWPLINQDDWYQFVDKESHDYLEIESNYQYFDFNMEKLQKKFTLMQPLLEKFNDNLLVAGGFYTFKPCYNNGEGEPGTQDIDIFIHSCNEQQACQIISEAVIFLVSEAYKPNNLPKNHNNQNCTVNFITVEHSLNVVNVNISYNGTISTVKYQLILRLYPSIDLILGGFDLACSMVGYDGKNIMATPMGAYCFANKRVIIDISRRSTTFAKRLAKYRNRGFTFVFPGFDKNTSFRQPKNSKDLAIAQIKEIAKKFDLEFKAYQFVYNYNGYADMPDRLSLDKAFQVKNLINFPDFTVSFDSDQKYLIPTKDKIKTEDKLIGDYETIRSYHNKECNLMYIMNNKSEFTFATFTINSENAKEVKKMWNDMINHPKIEVKKLWNKNKKFKHIIGDEVERFKEFGIFGYELCNLANTTKNYDEIFERMTKHRQNGIFLALKGLEGLKLITQNPGRQWTSSINPEIVSGSQFYGKYYRKIGVILSEEVETLLRLARRFSKDCTLYCLPRDIFNVIIMKIPFI